MRSATFAFVFAASLCSVWGQISQSHPEYCGRPGGANPPLANVSAAVDEHGEAVLYVGGNGSGPGIRLRGPELPSPISEIAEVCPIPNGRLVVFGDYGGTDVFVIDPAKAAVLDAFSSYGPVLSPDQRWIVYEKAYPLHGVEATAEYLLYDLAKTPARNRPEADLNNAIDVGSAIFPPGQKNVGGDNIRVPREQTHSRRSPFYWATDSRAILFEDKLEGEPFKIILITLDQKGVPTALEHGITTADLCGTSLPDLKTTWPRIERAEIGPDRNGARSIVLDLQSDDERCLSRIVQLSNSDFTPTKTETHIKQEPTHGAVVNGQEVVPPKKK